MKEIRNINILAIESSCDETAAAVVHNGRKVLSNIISSADRSAQIIWRSCSGNCIAETYLKKSIR